MRKAVLVIDMPKNCYECPCSKGDDFDDWCSVTGKSIYSYKERAEDCPIIVAPDISIKNIGADIDIR